MSRNKDIKLLHSVMGLKYSYLRKRLKANKWDYWVTYWKLQEDMSYRFDRLTLAWDRLHQAILESSGAFNDLSKSMEQLRKSIAKGDKE